MGLPFTGSNGNKKPVCVSFLRIRQVSRRLSSVIFTEENIDIG